MSRLYLSTLISKLHENEEKLRLHPNGFIQANIATGVRLHVWPEPTSGLQKQKTDNCIHDHNFALHSRILLGKLTNVLYEFMPLNLDRFEQSSYHMNNVLRSRKAEQIPTYEEYEATYYTRRDSKLQKTGIIGGLLKKSRTTMTVGSEYEMVSEMFHDSIPTGLTATLMRKTVVNAGYKCRVLCLHGEEPDNEYSRFAADEDVMWGQVAKVFNAITYIELDEGGLAT
jgi:hypothetical protein